MYRPAEVPLKASSKAGGSTATQLGMTGRIDTTTDSRLRRWVRWVPDTCKSVMFDHKAEDCQRELCLWSA